ncbi:LamG-like jellyroll fold domain-containing protein, partial [Kitasatospora sp. NPDC049258]|uniref:LamG domain-containing protein n=1 Tax=Kitasatospora sp. NPDC049258 TaxID=3155394 RepID=UPI00341F9845
QLGAVNREGANAEFFGGDIDDVRVYDRVVTGPEVADLVKQRPQLAGRWKLNTAAGSPLASPGEGPAHADAVLNGGAAVNAGGGQYVNTGTLQLNGTTAYAATTVPPVHTNRSFTLAGWASTVGSPTRDMTVLSQGGATADAVTLRWHYLKDDPTSGEHLGEWQAVVAGTDAAGAPRTVVVHSPAVGAEWTHLAVVYDALASRLSLYVNGDLENQVCTTGESDCTTRVSWSQAVRPFDATGGLQFGRSKASGSFGEYFSGELDDVWAFQGVLSGAQIIKLADYTTELDSATGP